jgi:hypothetical protein
MIEQSFSLISFPALHLPDITITGKIAHQNNTITLQYSLAGKIESIRLQSRSANPGRKDDLWKTTCFEFFLAIKDQPEYWEFNMSPSGDWNVYCMDAYRRVGFREETLIEHLQLEVESNVNRFTMNTAVDLNPIIQQGQLLEIGITAVIHTKDGQETYWALSHPAPQADFHLRESFTLALAGQTHPWGQSAPGD